MVVEEFRDAQEIGAGMAFFEEGEDTIVERFDGGGDEQAAGVLENGDEVLVEQEVFDFDGGVVGEAGEFAGEAFDDAAGVGGAVEEVGVAEGDVGGSGGGLVVDVGEDGVFTDDAEGSVVDGDDRAVAAEVLAAAGGFGVAGEAGPFGGDEAGVARGAGGWSGQGWGTGGDQG